MHACLCVRALDVAQASRASVYLWHVTVWWTQRRLLWSTQEVTTPRASFYFRLPTETAARQHLHSTQIHEPQKTLLSETKPLLRVKIQLPGCISLTNIQSQNWYHEIISFRCYERDQRVTNEQFNCYVIQEQRIQSVLNNSQLLYRVSPVYITLHHSASWLTSCHLFSLILQFYSFI